MTEYVVRIDKSKCIGCASCTMNAPEIFAMGPKGHAVIKKEFRKNLGEEIEGIIPEKLFEKAKKAERSCLGGAIEVIKR